MTTYISELMYIICGIVCIITAIRSLKNEKGAFITFGFWMVVAITFIFGPLLPSEVVGYAILLLALLSITKKVTAGSYKTVSEEVRQKEADRLGNKIFIPALALGIVAMILKQIGFVTAIAIGVGSIASIILGLAITKAKTSQVNEDIARLLQTVGAASLLPQLLAGLGSIFNKAGVGAIIANGISAVVPSNSILLGVVLYCLGMVIFTMIRGNAFAAFAVITVGIGIPFVIAQGGNPAVVGALGMTCGYCGTLMTPMAANFNIVAANVMECKSDYSVIKKQAPFALLLIVVHIILMLLLAF